MSSASLTIQRLEPQSTRGRARIAKILEAATELFLKVGDAPLVPDRYWPSQDLIQVAEGLGFLVVNVFADLVGDGVAGGQVVEKKVDLAVLMASPFAGKVEWV